MLISGILFIIIGLLILGLTIIKTVKMMKADNHTKIEKYNNTYETFTEVNTSKYNDIGYRTKNRYFKGTTQGTHMESENPTIIKTWLFGFGIFWFILNECRSNDSSGCIKYHLFNLLYGIIKLTISFL